MYLNVPGRIVVAVFLGLFLLVLLGFLCLLFENQLATISDVNELRRLVTRINCDPIKIEALRKKFIAIGT